MATASKHGLFSLLWFLVFFGSYCQMAPAAAGAGMDMGAAAGRQFEPGTGHAYRLESRLLLNEAGSGKKGKDVGFQVSAGVTVSTVWQATDVPHSKLLKMELVSPQLHIMSRKAPTPEGFISHTSKLEGASNSPFLVHWVAGNINHIFVAQGEELSLVNMKKGVASMFQFQMLDGEASEKDASGKCQVKYTSMDPYTILKTKSECTYWRNAPLIVHPERIMSTITSSERSTKYSFSRDLSVIDSISSNEVHEMTVVLRQDAGSSVTVTQELTRAAEAVKISEVKGDTLEEAVQEMEKVTKLTFDKQILVTQREPPTCQEECPTLNTLVKENREYLAAEHLGTIRSATAFTKLLSAVRRAKKEEIVKVLKNGKNKQILPQLYDLLGAAQTQTAHEAALRVLHLEDDSDLDLKERYFYALSLGSHPHPTVVKDVLKQIAKITHHEKLMETVVLTAAALANRLRKLPAHKDNKVTDEVKALYVEKLESCENNECRNMYLRGLKNLVHEDTIPVLLKYALTGSKKVSVVAMKALRSFPPHFWNDDVQKAAHRIYYQLDKQYDSSARTLAIDILLESSPSRKTLEDLLLSLSFRDHAYEVKQYLMQRVKQIAGKNYQFAVAATQIFHKHFIPLHNYNIAALRGLSTAFTRSFLKNPSGNGSLSTVQEMSGGLLKRGTVDIIVDNSGESQMLFSLGLFAGGLGSFISSDEATDANDQEEETATAGMELTVLGVQIRPFVFFNGQGELMGHVWSGTGSEKTPAFQVITLLQDHLQYIPLQAGFVAELSLHGTISFDLSGQIQLSLWNRNANSLVEKNAAILLQGLLKVDTSFVRSQVEFNVATETNLNLVSNIDFYSNIALCLQLKQPDSIVKHNIHKVERIPGSKHRLRKSKYKMTHVPGKTYALNRKNNEMCNVIFKSE